MVLQTTSDPGRYPVREWLPIAILGPFPMNQRIAYHYPAITDSPHPSNNKIAMVSTEHFRNRQASHFMVLGFPDDGKHTLEDAYREGWRDSENSSNGLACIQESDGWNASYVKNGKPAFPNRMEEQP